MWVDDEQRGVATTARIIIVSWGMTPTLAKYSALPAGLDTLDKLRVSGVYQYDIDTLMPVVGPTAEGSRA